ncbi:MAG TPA: alkaline phosphatase family protein [Pyrinomonadaceae bacterium]
MSAGNGSSVLAIGIDAAEPTLVKQLIEQNEMPALKALLDRGQWLRVQSPAPIGSGTVWPTFITGLDPTVHGVYSEWRWEPAMMGLSRYNGRHLSPFWKELGRNIRIGTLDIPFAEPIGLSEGFEVFEWWAHDSTGAGLQVGPKEILSLVRSSPPHPLSANRFANTTPNSQSGLRALSEASIEGARLRGMLARTLINQTNPRLALMVFPEIHHAGHQLWHTVNPTHRIYRDRKFEGDEPLLKGLYHEVDAQIGSLIESRGNGDAILVFALHGMRPASGFPAFLGPLLVERGFSRIANWSSQSWRGRALSLFAGTKRHTPDKLKRLYYKLTPATATHKLARPTMLPRYDWANTRAFALPTDQYGWIRINLVGREAEGSVQLDQYDDTCEQLKKLLLSLTNDEGQQLVRDIVSTASEAGQALSSPLPDLVVHWTDAAFALPLKISGSKVEVEPVARKSTGQHASEGFCIYSANGDGALNGALSSSGVVETKDLGRLITASLS